MAQHDYNLINQSGADFRADLNNALSAIVSNNSGSTEPATKFAYEWWVDESTGKMKLRNSANNAWITMPFNIGVDNSVDINVGTVNGITSFSFASGATVTTILDEDNLSTNSATALATQQSIKAYVDAQVTAQDLDITDGSSVIGIDLDSQTLSMLGGTGITSVASGQAVTFSIGQAVATSDNVVFNQVTAAVVGNASTATTLQNARNISGIAFDGSANITLNTSTITENTNLYFTNERVDDRVAAFIQNGTGISWVYADGSNTFTPTISLTPFNTGQLSEGSNLYYTDARFDTRLASKDTDNLSEGGNLYYTDARSNAAIDTRVNKTFIDNLNVVAATTSGLAGSASVLASARTIALTGDVVGSLTFNGSTDVSMATVIQANSVTLGTDTVGSYIKTITGTANKITVIGSGSETAEVTLTLPDDVQIADSLTVAGNLTVNGTLTSLDTTNLDIEDNLFQLNAGLTGSPVNDSGMLINRGNQNNGIFMWDESADKFTMGLTTADGTSTGNITLASLGTLVANLEGNVTGNVSGTAATVTGAAQTAITSVGTLTGLTTTGNINLGDNDKAIFGASADLQIYHDGSHSRIVDAGTGNLSLQGNDFRLKNSDASATYMEAANGGSVSLFYAGAVKLATASGGVTVTGNISNTSGDLTLDVAGDISLDADGGEFKFLDGGSESLVIGKTGGSPYIYPTAQDSDLIFLGNDGGVGITALTLDMSDAGTAIFNHDVKLGDNGKVIFGAGSDLQIYHDASNSYIDEQGTGSLYIKANDLVLSPAAGGQFLVAYNGGSVVLYHNNNQKLATTSTGIDVTGVITTDGLTTSADINFGDNDKAIFGAGSDLQIYHDGTNSYVKDDGTGDLYIQGEANVRITDGDGNKMFLGQNDGEVQLYYNGTEKLNTTSTGINVTGTITGDDGLSIQGGSGNAFLQVGSDTGSWTWKNYRSSHKLALEDSDGTGEVLSFSTSGAATFNSYVATPTLASPDGTGIITLSNTARVGIGTTSPTVPLTVNNSTDHSDIAIFHAGGGTPNRGLKISTFSNTNSNAGVELDAQHSTGALKFSTGGTERMRIRETGAIEIKGSSTTTNAQAFITNDNSVLTIGSSVSGSVVKDIAFNSPSTMMYIDGSSGNVGIGNTSPAFENGNGLEIRNSSGNGSHLKLTDNASGTGATQGFDLYMFNSQAYIENYENAPTVFRNNGGESARIDASGNLQLGNTTGSRRLNVFSDTDRYTMDLRNESGFNSGELSGIVFSGKYDSSNNITDMASIGGGKDNTTDGNFGGRLSFFTRPHNGSDTERMRITGSGVIQSTNGTTVGEWYPSGGVQYFGTATNHPIQFFTNNSAAMRLDSSGTLLLGGTSSTANAEKLAVLGGSSTGALFSVEATHTTPFGAVKFRNGNGEVGSISLFSTSTAYNTSSDARLKDVTGEARGLEVINELNPVAYNWKADGKADEGLIAQEVMDIVPNAVSGSEEEMYQMDYSKLVVHLVAGMKEQQTQIEELKTQINNLKGE